ncbi:hypothetical protein G7K_0710-t1 [Saitoella complicata NRRL Y-17804]|uniref:mRNA 3'-end-processing protein RNA14 n=2 Tax=Saitoella complicata (strain BCRC 22490 / CBS 7301 / JCM 7358 / NBRC 10748 / NRRL Y-17804) TaxID=698492 RepID=A0A0E9N9I2_SAICN|nr:hypothetical protein G7K_0710-t1 [Saitoella complicata NRRL Y-17804]
MSSPPYSPSHTTEEPEVPRTSDEPSTEESPLPSLQGEVDQTSAVNPQIQTLSSGAVQMSESAERPGPQRISSTAVERATPALAPTEAQSGSSLVLELDSEAEEAQAQALQYAPEVLTTSDDKAVPPALSSIAEPEPSAIAAAMASASPVLPKIPKRKRLANDHIGQLQDRIAADPKDFDAWKSLIEEQEEKEKFDDARETYERFLKLYPLAGPMWISYLKMELAQDDHVRAQTIFTKCLRSVLDLDLWRFYLDYIRRVNNVLTGGAQARMIISQAYEFVLSNIGMDYESGPIWKDYLDFIKSGEATTSWEESQKMDHTRKTYQRAICIPLSNIEQLWREYDQFENGINRTTARKFLAERSPSYMTARSSLKELRSIIDSLDRKGLPKTPTFTKQDREKVEAWKKWIAWERSDPLVLEDAEALKSRVMYACQRAMMSMYFHPEIWFSVVEYAMTVDDQMALEFLKTGMAANPSSLLLHFQFAEIEESRGRPENVKQTLQSLVDSLQGEMERVQREWNEAKADAGDSKVEEEYTIEDEDENEGAKVAKPNKRLEAINTKYKAQIDTLARESSIVWVMFLRTTRRIEGLKPARQVFTRARKAPNQTYEVFVASALMEYHWNKEPGVAVKIFELGMKAYSENAHFVLQYLKFLRNINDETNARALFERTITKLSPEAALPLYEHFYNYESNYGDLSAALKLDARMAELYPQRTSLERFRTRYSYLDFDAIAEHDLGGNVESKKPAQPAKEVDSDAEESAVESDDDRYRSAPTKSAVSRLREEEGASPRKKDRKKDNKRDRDGEKASSGGTKRKEAPPLPDPLMYLLSVLPPADMYQGALFKVDELIRLLQEANLPPPPISYDDGEAAKRQRMDDDFRGTPPPRRRG